MQIQNVDFVAEQTSAPGFLKAATHESFGDARNKMNDWLARNDVEIISVETVVLPSLHSPHEEGSEDVAVHVKPEFGINYNQFIRVWFKENI